MLGFAPIVPADRPLRLLAIGSHSDDIEFGCGGTILRLVEEMASLEVQWVVLSGDDERSSEARASAGAFLEGVSHEVLLGGFRDGFFPHDPNVKEFYEALKAGPSPDLVLVHTRSDLHQDHRVACELAWNTFRDHAILEYEIAKYDGDLGSPNVFVPLDDAAADEKLGLLREHFATQRTKHWFDDELFRGLMRIRGTESATRYAEAFTCRKLSLFVA